MRRALLLALLALAACRSRIQQERPSDVYAGVAVSGLPGVGAGITVGQLFSDRSDKYDFAFEMTGTWQTGEDSATQEGHFFQVQGGVKQTLSPGHREHLVFRYGLTWLRATGDPAIFDRAGDYLGVYGGAGYEWDLSPRFTIGPGLEVAILGGEGSLPVEILPRLTFGAIFKF